MSPGRRRETPSAARERRAGIDDPAIVLEAALRFLGPRARSEAEVRRRLIGAGYRPDPVEGAVARLIDLGMLDDAAFARAWVESRDRARPRGEHALRRELRLKGVRDDIIAEALAERAGEIPENAPSVDEAAAGRLLARKGSALARIADPRTRRQRAYALLVRAGFDGEIASRLTAPISASSGSTPGDD